MKNLKDVAKEAGVSTATVSRYINNVGFISDELKSKINKAIKELNYYPNKVARSLSKGKTGIIGIIIPDITNPFFPELVKGASDLLITKGYHVHLCSSENDFKKEELFLRDFQSMRVDGIIIVPSDSEKRDSNIFNEIMCPIVMADREITGLDIDIIVFSNKKGAYDAVNYLIQNGHKKIVFLGGSIVTVTAQKRSSGWEKAMKENNLSIDNLSYWGDYSVESGYLMMNDVFNKLNKIDAVFASNDLIALGAIQSIKEKGLSIPNDISIVGFDDIYICKFLTPPLTVIHQPIYEIGSRAVELLLNRISKKKNNNTTKRIVLTGELIIRGSVNKKA